MTERFVENGFEFFRDHANSMYGVQDSSTLKNRLRLAEEICKIEQNTADAIRGAARSRAFEQKLIAMWYDWELLRGKLDHRHAATLRDVLQVIDTSIQDVRTRIQKAQDDSAASESNMRDSYNMTRRKLSKELGQARSFFDQLLRDLRSSVAYESEVAKVELCSEHDSALHSMEVDARAHMARILEIQRKQYDDLTDYFGQIISSNDSEISELRRRVTELKARIDQQSQDMSRLQSENETVSCPLEDLRKQKRILREQLQVVETGTMAYKNFKQLQWGLQRHLERINSEISRMEEVIQNFDMGGTACIK